MGAIREACQELLLCSLIACHCSLCKQLFNNSFPNNSSCPPPTQHSEGLARHPFLAFASSSACCCSLLPALSRHSLAHTGGCVSISRAAEPGAEVLHSSTAQQQTCATAANSSATATQRRVHSGETGGWAGPAHQHHPHIASGAAATLARVCCACAAAAHGRSRASNSSSSAGLAAASTHQPWTAPSWTGRPPTW